MIDQDDIETARKAIKKMKAHASETVRRVGEGFEDILRAVENDPRGIEAAMDEVNDVLSEFVDS